MLIRDLFLLRPEPYVHACENRWAGLWVAAFLMITGVLYGTLVALFERALGGELSGPAGSEIQRVPVDQIPNTFLFTVNIVAGLLKVLVAHLSITLIAWLMARGVGGPGGIIGLYRTTAYLLPLTIPALPKIAVDTATAGRDMPAVPFETTYTIMTAASVIMVLVGHYQAIRVTQDVSPGRAAASVGLFALFIGSLLLLF